MTMQYELLYNQNDYTISTTIQHQLLYNINYSTISITIQHKLLYKNKIYDNLSNEIAEEIILRLIEKTA